MARSTDWGQREKHPLYGAWCHHRRKRENGMVLEWSNDFWLFVSGIGERPSDRHRLKKHRADKPIGPDNFFWDETYFDGDRAKYMKEYRKRRPERVRNTVLKRMFGITVDEYEAMLKAQGGVCKICEKPQVKSGVRLCVDHCHGTGRIRGLLCDNCNRAIGLMRDDPDLLARAIAYLRPS